MSASRKRRNRPAPPRLEPLGSGKRLIQDAAVRAGAVVFDPRGAAEERADREAVERVTRLLDRLRPEEPR